MFDEHAMLEEIVFVKNQDLKDEFGIYKSFVLRTAIPTFEQVFEWFREKGFQSHIEYTLDNSMFKIHISGLFLQTKDSYFKTYEEAREALVNKLIEFYEDNSWVTH